MPKRIGANKRKKHVEGRQQAGRATSKMFAKSKVVVVCIVVASAAIFGAYKLVTMLRLSPMFTVAKISVEGTTKVDKGFVLKAANITTGMRMIDIKPGLIKNAIQKNAWVKDVKVARQFPNNIVIHITERAPVALACIKKVYYVDDDGRLLSLFPGTFSNLPVVSGLKDTIRDSSLYIASASLVRLKKFLEEAKNADNDFVKKISQINFGADGIIKLRCEDVPTVIELSEEQVVVAMQRAKQLMQETGNGAGRAAARINLYYANLAFVQ
jgi:cell division septal protein FtsQ